MDKHKSIRFYSVDYFKYFCALLIIVIHLKPLEVISKDVGYLSANTLPRIAVPFFFAVSGFFFSQKLYEGQQPFRRYTLKLLTVYTVWSAAYALRLLLIELKNGRLTGTFIKELCVKYCFFGISEHLWYCLSLAVSILLLTLLHKLKLQRLLPYLSLLLMAFSCLVFTYYNAVGQYIPFLKAFCSYENHTTVFRLLVFGPCYVFLGDTICRKQKKLLTSDKLLYSLLGVVILLHAAEKTLNILRGDNLLLNITLYPLVFLILCVLLKHPGNSNHAALARYLRNASAFTYYSHLLLIDIFGYVIANPLIRYFIVAAAALIASALLTRLNNKKLNYLLM